MRLHIHISVCVRSMPGAAFKASWEPEEAFLLGVKVPRRGWHPHGICEVPPASFNAHACGTTRIESQVLGLNAESPVVTLAE